MDIRQKFLKYFEKKGHIIIPSSGLIPHNDPSVLLTTAGMQQFKPYYLGMKKPPGKRIATVQKCFRTSDIDSVGYTERHLTFFEMLGNFSFADYFKKEAINYSLDFLLNDLGITESKLVFTVFKGNKDIPADLESIKYWQEKGISTDRIYQYGKEDNFWGPAGDTGPCGPCAEIHYDFGEGYGCGSKDCNPNCGCSRFLEIWNLVFTQYNFNGIKYIELPQKNIDTGMGLERITAVLEGNSSVFKTSLFNGIIKRSIRFGRLIGIRDYFLNDIGKLVIDEYSKVYPGLLEKKEFSFKLVSDEEKRFTKTLKEGSKVLLQKINEIKKNKEEYLNPEDAFKLYDTFGFPVELTGEILKEKIIKFDRSGNKKLTSRLSEGEKGEIILKETPFYGEKGGQVGDRGIIRRDNNVFIVQDCTIPVEGIYVHRGFVEKGILKVGDEISAEVDYNHRKSISKNHTATHILHWVLRSLYGSEVKQAGSFVGEDRFRFDYSIYNAPSEENLNKIERIINEKIQNNDPVRCFETTREFAGEIGAVALFDEKYGKFVRVVEINNYSRELCGGIHVEGTGEIGLFKIISDSSIGANLRRIEAATGMSAYKYLEEKEKILKKISASLEVEDNKILDTLEKVKDSMKKKEEELEQMKIKTAKKEILKKFRFIKSQDEGLKIIDFDFSNSEP